jgi:putative ABC transport system permease protein
LSRFRPAEVLKGTLKVEGKHTLVRVLTTLQFSLSIFLMIVTLFKNSQMNHMLEKDLGYNEQQVVMINGPASPEGRQIIERLRSILQNDPDVLGVSGSWNRVGSAEGLGFQYFIQKQFENLVE